MDPRKRKRSPFGDIWDMDFGPEFSESFRKMEEQMARIFKDISNVNPEEMKSGEPYVYGFSMRVGPDGVPHVEEFGNTRGSSEAEQTGGSREPLTDVIPSKTELTVIAEVPGVTKKDIELTTRENELTIRVDTERRKYYKKIALPEEVEFDSAKANYNNGVLEVKLKKKPKAEEPVGKKISID